MLEWCLSAPHWVMYPCSDDDYFPPSRHGHLMIARPCDNQILILGGHLWGFANDIPIYDLVFNLTEMKFHVANLFAPNRFAASSCYLPLHAPAESRSVLLIFAGLNEQRELCNDLLAVDLATGRTSIQPYVGVPPPPQFKGGMALDASGTRAFVFDGYTESGIQKVHMLVAMPSGALVWRAIAAAAPVARFAHAPLYGGRMVALIGGMGRKSKRRVNLAHIFDLVEMRWVSAIHINGLLPLSAHTVTACCTSAESLIIYGGSLEWDTSLNNRGRPTGMLFVLSVPKPSLRYLATLALWKMFPAQRWLPTGASDQPDAILEDLFYFSSCFYILSNEPGSTPPKLFFFQLKKTPS